MKIVNIISALGNNNSIYPLLVRDCGIENTAKCAITYQQNAKESKFIAREATRERIIDEYGTSALWLGGIPLISKVADKIIKTKGFSPEVSTKLLDEKSVQNLSSNIEKFKNIAPKETLELLKVKENKKFFTFLQTGKLLAKTAIPFFLMGYILPKMNFKLTQKKLKENKNKENFLNTSAYKIPSLGNFQKANAPSFKGNLNSILNMNQLQNMMILDAGLSAGRIATGRNLNEKIDLGVKMAGMCYLNYIAPSKIEKGLNALTKKLFGVNVDLDPKILADSDFLASIKNNSIIESASKIKNLKEEKEILNFIDSNMGSNFVKTAKKLNLVSTIKENDLVRDPRKFVEVKEVKALANKILEFGKSAVQSENIEKFSKKALFSKSFNILANVAISSFLLAFCLPKFQFLLRKFITGSSLEPGLIGKIEKKQEMDV